MQFFMAIASAKTRARQVFVIGLLMVTLVVTGCSASQGLGGAKDATRLTWSPPAARDDGSSLEQSDIEGYRVYYKQDREGRFQRIDIDDPLTTSLSLDRFPPGNYQFEISTVDTDGLESQRSETIHVTVN